jgi:lipoyl(octanoyl) transferase
MTAKNDDLRNNAACVRIHDPSRYRKKSMTSNRLIIRTFEPCPYLHFLQAMQDFTQRRDDHTNDEVWLLEHQPVFTQGQNGKPEHILDLKDIPLVKTDRGGQITYHGPGQIMMYTLIDLKRKAIHIRQFVGLLEQTIIDFLTDRKINTSTKCDARGVYVRQNKIEKKICSIGLRVKRGCTYHGLAFNVNMNLEPFSRINPCGYIGLPMTHLAEWIDTSHPLDIGKQLVCYFIKNLGYTDAEYF